MKILKAKQGDAAWHAHRLNHHNASDAPAMMGCSKYKTRSQLITEAATGLSEEVSAETQQRFDAGHAYEALARPGAEVILGEDLYPVTGYEGTLSASFDGLTLDDRIAWEHKSLNDVLRSVLPAEGVGDESVGASLPMMYRVQMEQQALVSGCEKVLFTASKWQGEDLVESRHCWYMPDPELRAQLVAGWAQFEADVNAYQPPAAAAPVAVAEPVAALPVVFDMRVEGRLVSCNLEQYKPAALAYIEAINTDLTTDQHFADADADGKFCRESASKLEMSVELALGKMGDVNNAINTVREIAAAFNAKGLALEKLVKSEKERRKTVIVMERQTALREHCAALSARVGVPVAGVADFGAVIKGLKTIASAEDKLDTELARAKIAASQIADLIDGNRKAMEAADAAGLFPDFASTCTKPADDFANLVASRKAAAEAAQAKRIEEAMARARAEEAQRIQREAEAKAREEAEAKRKADAEAQARADAEARAEQQRQADAAEFERRRNAATVGHPDYQPLPVAGIAQAVADQSRISAPAPEVRAFTPRAAAPAVTEEPTLSLGRISSALGFTVTADLLARLGFAATVVKAARLYRPSQFAAIKRALIEHIEAVPDEVPLAA